jgi:hypothetical protein
MLEYLNQSKDKRHKGIITIANAKVNEDFSKMEYGVLLFYL